LLEHAAAVQPKCLINEFLVEGIVMLLSAEEFTVEQALLLVDGSWD